MYVRSPRHLGCLGKQMQCIKLLSVNTKVSCICGLKSSKVAKRLGRSPRPLWVSFAYPLGPCWDDQGPISLSALAAAYQPSLQNPRSTPIFVGGGRHYCIMSPGAQQPHYATDCSLRASLRNYSFDKEYDDGQPQ